MEPEVRVCAACMQEHPASTMVVAAAHRTAAMTRFERMDALLGSFMVDDLPYFSRTVLTSSPVLLTLHLEGGDAVPLPHVAVGTSGTLPPQPLTRRTSAGSSRSIIANSVGDAGAVDAPELPVALQQLLRQHKRAAHSLFHRWEEKGQREVSLRAFAEGVRQITGTKLTDEDLHAVMQVAEPVRGEVMTGADEDWRSRPIDCNRLWRRLQSSAARLASEYIHNAHGQKAVQHVPPVPPVRTAQARPAAGASAAVTEAAVGRLKDALGRRLTELTDLFHEWDEDDNGLVDRAEWRRAVAHLGLKFDEAVVDAVFDSYDTDGGGTIGYDEYIHYSLRDALARSCSRVMDLFKKWDVDESGTVDRKEWRIALKELGFEAPRDVVDELFASMDKDGDGLIDFLELHAQLRQGASIRLAKELLPGAAGEISLDSRNPISLRSSPRKL